MNNFSNRRFLKSSLALALSSVLTTTSLSVYADENAVETIEVTSSRHQQPLSEVLADVEVINRDQIEKTQATSITDLLSQLAGLDVVKLGGNGQNASLYSRGTNSGHTLILVDGVRIGAATIGYKSISQIPTTQIERIEVIRGPRAALWGSDATGAVIHIITRKLHSNEFTVSGQVGSDRFAKLEAAVGLGDQDNNLTIAASRETEEGFSAIRFENETDDANKELDNDGYDRNSLSIRGQATLTDSLMLEGSGQFDDGFVEFDSNYQNLTEYENYFANLKATHESDHWLNSIAYNKSKDDSVSYGNGTDRNSEFASAFTTRREQINWLSLYSINQSASVTGGIDYYDENVNTTLEKRDVLATYLQFALRGDLLMLDLAARNDSVDYGDRSDDDFNYNLAVGAQWTDSWLTSFNYSTSFKLPSFNDLYWPGSESPDLVPEQGKHAELINRINYGAFAINFNVYQSEIEQLIAWAPAATDENPFRWAPSNINQVDILGGELKFVLDTAGTIHELQISHVDSEDQATGRQLMRRARKKATYQVETQLGDLSALLQYQYNGGRTDSGFDLGGYSVANLAFNYPLNPSWIIRFKIDNLFDKDYVLAKAGSYDWMTGVHNSYNTPGRRFYLGVEYRNF